MKYLSSFIPCDILNVQSELQLPSGLPSPDFIWKWCLYIMAIKYFGGISGWYIGFCQVKIVKFVSYVGINILKIKLVIVVLWKQPAKMLYKKYCSWKTVLESLFNNIACFQACNFIKKTLQHKCFPVNIEIFKNTCFEDHLRTPASGFMSAMSVHFYFAKQIPSRYLHAQSQQ